MAGVARLVRFGLQRQAHVARVSATCSLVVLASLIVIV